MDSAYPSPRHFVSLVSYLHFPSCALWMCRFELPESCWNGAAASRLFQTETSIWTPSAEKPKLPILRNCHGNCLKYRGPWKENGASKWHCWKSRNCWHSAHGGLTGDKQNWGRALLPSTEISWKNYPQQYGELLTKGNVRNNRSLLKIFKIY